MKLKATNGLSWISILDLLVGVGRVFSMILVSGPVYTHRPIAYVVLRKIVPRKRRCLKERDAVALLKEMVPWNW